MRRCLHCGAELRRMRIDARYCSPHHRAAAKRSAAAVAEAATYASDSEHAFSRPDGRPTPNTRVRATRAAS